MADKKLELLKDDIKLLKGEIKQSLASVRDYLLNMELPSSEIANILSALGADGEQKITMQGNLTSTGDAPPPQEAPRSNPPQSVPQNDFAEQEEFMDMGTPLQEDPLASEPVAEYQTPQETFDSTAGSGLSMNDTPAAPGLPDSGEVSRPWNQEDKYQDYDDSRSRQRPAERYEDYAGLKNDPLPYTPPPQASPEDNIPRVNMLANLINWVSRAKQEIGFEQLPTFLEVYGISGHLSPELKDIILHLAEITGDKPSANTNAGVWSESMLTLHGILTGGEVPMHPVLPSWSADSDITDQLEAEEIAEPEEDPQEAPVKLKLVFPSTDGKSREFCIDLAPEQPGNDTAPHTK